MEDKTLDQKEIKQGAPLAAISYISFICIIVLALKSKNTFVNFHAKQGLVLFIAQPLSYALRFIPLFGDIASSIGFLIVLLLSVYGLFSALTGKMTKIPVVSDIAAKFVI